ncbi:MAG TPA: nuclear transport factor 2 family protein [Candidatus Dormibacteraeota bacterium]|nr:nuclear transport factor 2 family protein [Candidatus Dormibacteraeota bacterium]
MSAADDRAAITALIMGYAERIDAGDLAGVAAYFAEATYRSVQGGEYHGAAAVRAVLEERVMLYDGVPRTKHVTTNLVIALAADAATARSYFTVLQAAAGAPLQPIVAGRYHDRFVRVDGAWRFADRLIFMDLIGDLSRHLKR